MGSLFSATHEIEQLTRLFSPTLVATDHRTVGYGTLRGAHAVLEAVEAIFALSEDFRWRVDDVLALTDQGLVLYMTNMGLVRATGGEFEREILQVFVFGSDGLLAHWEQFEPERADEALARFDTLTAGADVEPDATVGAADPMPPEAFRTAAGLAKGAVWRAFRACSRARDWEGLTRLLPPGFRYHDRRRFSQLEMDREQYIAYHRQLADMPSASSEVVMLATRGEQLRLGRWLARVASPDTGQSEIEVLVVWEVDAGGVPVAMVGFDPDALHAAYAELDARWDAHAHTVGDRAAIAFDHLEGAFAARDWDAYAPLLTPDVALRDRRLLGFGTVQGSAEYVRLQRSLPDLAPDARRRVDHLLTSRRGLLMQSMQVGTRDGGAFETPFLGVLEFDAQYRIQRIDAFPVESQREARARFEAIDPPAVATPASPRFENLATRAQQRLTACWQARDWQALACLRAPGFRFLDRSRIAQLELDAEQHTEYVRSTGEMDLLQAEGRILATRGERLALAYSRIVVAGGDVGESEITSLFFYETDERGAIVTFVRFDADDLDAAYAEHDARYDALDGGSSLAWIAVQRWLRATHTNDWEAHAAALAPDFVREDHRLLGFGTIAGAAEYERLQRALFDLAPDTRFRLDHVRVSVRGALHEGLWHGTRDGGRFEMPLLFVGEADAEGRIRRVDIYDLDQLDQAHARFAALGGGHATTAAIDPLRIPPNAVTRQMDGWLTYGTAGDWEKFRGLFAPGEFDDRRRGLRTHGGIEMAIENSRILFEQGFRPTVTVLATAGERLALFWIDRAVWDGGVKTAEAVSLVVEEVDADGRATAVVIFDGDARAAASDELLERYAAGGADGLPPSWIEFTRAIAAHDLTRVRTLLYDDFVFHDRRRTGVGRLEGADAYLPSLAAVFELSPDARLEDLYTVAVRADARVSLSRWWGTNRAGGAFEIMMAAMACYRDGRLAGIEIWEPEDLDAAVARFEELRGGKR